MPHKRILRARIQRRRLRVLTAVAVLSGFAVIALASWMLYDARHAAQREAEQAAGNLALSLERDIARNIEIYDLSLRSAASLISAPGLAELAPELRQAALFDNAVKAANFGGIAVLDAAGAIIYESGSAQPRAANLGDRDWFLHLRANPGSGLHLSLTPNSLFTGRQSLVLSRRIEHEDGSFAGAVAGVIYLDYFRQLFSDLRLASGNVIVLLTADGKIVSRRPFADADVGRSIGGAEVFRLVREHPYGSFENESAVDGVRRIYSYRRVADLPLVVQVGFSTDSVYAEWRQKAWLTSAIVAAFALMSALFSCALWRELGRRSRAEAASRESEEAYRLLADSTTDAITRLDLDLRRTYASPACRSVYGCDPADMLGGTPRDTMHPDEAERVCKQLYSLADGTCERDRATYRVRHKHGHWVWVEVDLGLMRDPATGSPMSIVCSVRDISDRVLQEEELRHANSELDRLARHLARARDRAEKASRTKSRFLAGMSHELRTPLNGVLGYAQLLRREGDLNPTQVTRVEAMLEAGTHLLEMINCVLDLSQIEAGQLELHPQPFLPEALARACVDLVRPAAETKHLALRVGSTLDRSQRVVADPVRVRQILLNLLGNAVKFTPAGSIDVNLRLIEGVKLRVEVVDTGTGIRPGQRHRLFQDFDRLVESNEIEGSGLGLALSLQLAKRMGGVLDHRDNPRGGSVFWFEVPVSVAGEPAVQPIEDGRNTAQDSPSAARALRVMVADDVAMNRDIARALLRRAGHEVTCVDNGGAAVAEASAKDFDVILMDVRMPEVDGLEASRRIRALAGPRGRVPIVALTAQAFSEQVEECRRAGMDAHLAKPFAEAALLEAVTRVARAEGDEGALVHSEPDGDVPVLDQNAFAETTAVLSPASVQSYLGTLLDRSERLLSRLGAGQQAAHLTAEAHVLAGSAGMFGFERLAAAARVFEREVQLGSHRLDPAVEKLSAALRLSIQEMRPRASGLTAMETLAL